MGQTGRKDGISRCEVRCDSNPGIAKDAFDTDHQIGQVDGSGIDWTREDDVDFLGETGADHAAGEDSDVCGVDRRRLGVLDEQRLSGWNGEVEVAGLEVPAVADGHALAGGILDDIDSQRGIEAEQQHLILDVGLEVTDRDEADNGAALRVSIEGKCPFDVLAAEKGVAILGDQLAGGEDLSLAGTGDRERAFVNRSGVDRLVKGDRDLGDFFRDIRRLQHVLDMTE